MCSDTSADSALAAEHTPESVAGRLRRPPSRRYLRDAVYGAIDGAVTTFAVVAGSRGASLTGAIVLILGFSNLVADGFSMATGNYLGVRTVEQRRRRTRNEELRQIALVPEGEREEIRQIFAAKGFTGSTLAAAVDVITADRERWVQTMLVEEHGLSPLSTDPFRSALATFLAFFAAGLVPLVPFLLGAAGIVGDDPYLASALCTAVVFVAIGIARAEIVGLPRWRASAETVALGGAAAGLAFVLGVVLQGLV